MAFDSFSSSTIAVDCLWIDYGSPLYHVTSSESLPNLMGNVGKHLALGIYKLTYNLVATPSTLHVRIEIDEATHSRENVKLALTFAANPAILETIGEEEKKILVNMGLLTAAFELTPFPNLHRTDCFDPISLQITTKSAPDEEEDPLTTYMKQNPSYVPTYIELKKLAIIEDKELSNPSLVLVGWSNIRPSTPSKTIEPWIGTSGGRKVQRRAGAKSRIHWMVAEICRQVYRGYYKVSSISAFAAEVLIVVDCDREDREVSALVDLIVTGGQPQDRRMLEFLENRHLLS